MEYKFLDKNLIRVKDIQDEFTSKAVMYKVLNKLIQEERIVRLKKNLYATTDEAKCEKLNRFEIATALHKDAYIAYHSALEFYGLATQFYFDVYTISAKKYNPLKVGGLEYYTFLSNYNDGVEEITFDSLVRVTELERTVIDCMDKLYLAGGIEELYYALLSIEFCDEQKLLKHLKGYNKKVLYKKAGYLFSRFAPDYLTDNFYQICQDNMPQRKDDLRENEAVDYVYDEDWKIYAPEELINTKY